MVIKYPELLTQIKQRIRQGQVRAIMAANAEMIALYWDIGQLIAVRQHLEGWGAAVIPRLARDLHNELPEVKGFSERNIKLMVQFYREYPELFPNGQLPVAQKAGQVLSDDEQVKSALMQRLVAQIPWSHNVLLLQKVKDIKARVWYGQALLEHGWSRDVLNLMIEGRSHERQGKVVSNFSQRLPPAQSDLVQQTLKDPYLFDFLTMEEPFHERELETALIRHLERFLLELGQGFAFVGGVRQIYG